MRDVATIKTDIKELKASIDQIETAITKSTQNMQRIQLDLQGLDASLDSLIIQERETDKKRLLNKVAEPYNIKIGEAEKKLKDLEIRKKKRISEVNIEEIKEALANKVNLDDNIKFNIQSLSEEVEEFLGKGAVEFYNNSILGDIQSSPSQIIKQSKVVNRYNKKYIQIEESTSAKVSKKFSDVLMSMADSFAGFSDEQNSQSNAVSIIAPIITAIVISPIYHIQSLATGYTNLRKSQVLIKAMPALHELKQNEKLLENSIMDKAQSTYDAEVEEIEKEAKIGEDKLNETIDTIKNMMSKSLAKAEKNFVFDEKKVRELVSSKKVSLGNQLDEEESRNDNLKEQLISLKEKLEQLEIELDDVFNSELRKFLDPTYNEQVVQYPDKLLFDTKPYVSYINGIDKSQAIFYNSRNLVEDFIMSIIFQLRNIVMAGLLEFLIVDQITMAKSFTNLRKIEEKETYNPTIFAIKKDEIVEEINKKKTTFFRNYKMIVFDKQTNITKYNQDMLDNDSIPAKYMIIILLDPSPELLEQLEPLLRNGSDVGIYIYYFIDETKDVKQYKISLDATQIITMLSEKGLVTRKVGD